MQDACEMLPYVQQRQQSLWWSWFGSIHGFPSMVWDYVGFLDVYIALGAVGKCCVKKSLGRLTIVNGRTTLNEFS